MWMAWEICLAYEACCNMTAAGQLHTGFLSAAIYESLLEVGSRAVNRKPLILGLKTIGIRLFYIIHYYSIGIIGKGRAIGSCWRIWSRTGQHLCFLGVESHDGDAKSSHRTKGCDKGPLCSYSSCPGINGMSMRGQISTPNPPMNMWRWRWWLQTMGTIHGHPKTRQHRSFDKGGVKRGALVWKHRSRHKLFWHVIVELHLTNPASLTWWNAQIRPWRIWERSALAKDAAEQSPN